MNQRIKNYLGIAIIVTILVVAYSVWSYSQSYSESIQPSSFRSFSVTGEGKAVAIPDVAEFTFSVITEGGKNIADLERQNTTATNKAIEYVKNNGVADKDIKTQGYNITPRYQTCYNPPILSGVGSASTCPPPTIVGYAINQTVQVKVRDFTKVGDILSGVVANGANQTSDLNFTIDDPTAVQNQARTLAIQKAEAQAQVVAEAAGFGIGRLLGITENSGSQPFPIYARALSMGAATNAAPSPEIQPGSQDVVVDVTMTYEIK